MKSIYLAFLMTASIFVCGATHARASCPDGELTIGAPGDSSTLLAAVWYKGHFPIEHLANLDFNGDGKVDSDDYLDIRDHLEHKKAPFCRKAPATPPLFIPRYAEVRWWEKDKDKLTESLKKLCSDLDQSRSDEIDNVKDPSGAVLARRSLKLMEELGEKLGSAGSALSPADRDNFCHSYSQAQDHAEHWRMVIKDWEQDRPAGRDYLEACAAANSGQTISHSSSAAGNSEWCPAIGPIPLPKYSAAYKYKIVTENGKMKIEMPIYFNFTADFPGASKMKALEAWHDSLECVQDYWKRYGVTYEFKFDPQANASFQLHPGNGRSDAGNFYPELKSQLNCFTMVHELGHKMGLPDEYDGTGDGCPNRKKGEDDGVMSGIKFRGAGDTGLKDVRWYPRNLELMFKPPCGKAS